MSDLLSNTDAIYAENPFLEKIFPRRKVSIASVKRWNDEFLGLSGNRCSYLLDEHGQIVEQVGHWYDWLLGRSGTVSETLARIDAENRRRVHSAVVAGYDIEAPIGILTFYKLPNGFENADGWFESRIAESRKAIHEFS